MTKRKSRADESNSRKKSRKTESDSVKQSKASTRAQTPAPTEVMEYPNDFHLYRLAGLRGCMKLKELNETVFKIGSRGKEFKTTKLAVSSVSPKILEMIRQSDEPYIIENVTSSAFHAIVLFAYGEDPNVTELNVVEVADAARLLDIPPLETQCKKFIHKILNKSGSEEQILKYLEIATKFQNNDIVKLCFDSLQDQGGIPTFLSSPAFCELSAELVNMILKLDELPVKEVVVWETCLNWATAQAQENGTDRNKELRKIYHNVRFPLFDAGFFSSQVVPTGLMSQEETLMLFQYLTFPAGNSSTEPFSKTRRILWDETEVPRYLTDKKPFSGEKFNLDGYIDGIVFQCNHNLELLGVGTLVGEGSTKSVLRVFEGNGEDRKKVGQVRETIKSAEKRTGPYQLKFANPIQIKKDTSYELELDQIGACSLKMVGGVTDMEVSKNGLDVEFNFSKLKSNDENDTSVKKGNLPTLYVRILS